MKANTLWILAAIPALSVVPAFADDARVTAYQSQLRAVRVTHVAPEAAKLVIAEKAEARAAAAADAVTAAVSLNAPSTPLVVGSVAKASPEAAASAAAAAVKLQPKMAGLVSKAAVSAAPSEIAAIVSSMCRAQPTSFYSVGVAAAEAAPKSSDKVLPAITAAVPALKPLIARSQADFAAAKRAASLALVLKHTEDLLAAYSRDAKVTPEAMLAKETETTMATRLASSAAGPAPVLLPPFVPSGTPPGEVSSAGTTTVSPGTRVNYAAP